MDARVRPGRGCSPGCRDSCRGLAGRGSGARAHTFVQVRAELRYAISGRRGWRLATVRRIVNRESGPPRNRRGSAYATPAEGTP